MSRILLTALALLASWTPMAGAQSPKPIVESQTTSVTATIQAIDRGNRLVTLKGEKGRVVTMKVGPEVERFDAMKVGDVVTARYIESVAIHVLRPGEKAPDASLGVGSVPRPGEKPGVTLSEQRQVKVKVTEIDLKAQALSVATPDGNVLSFKARDPKRLEQLKVGDEIEVVYTEAVLLTVDAAKK